MLTADTITDEQIRELRRDTFARYQRGESVREQLDVEAAALRADGGTLGLPSFWARRITQTEARARCAEILNTRAAKEGR